MMNLLSGSLSLSRSMHNYLCTQINIHEGKNNEFHQLLRPQYLGFQKQSRDSIQSIDVTFRKTYLACHWDSREKKKKNWCKVP